MWGIPIRVNSTTWIVIALLASSYAKDLGFLTGIFLALGLFASVALHELGHSYATLQLGGKIKSITLLPFGGVASMLGNPKKPKDEVIIALAGPATSILLAAICWQIRLVYPELLINLAFINLSLGLFNLLPSFPMDGGRVFRALMVPRLGKLEATKRAVQVGRIFAIGFGLLGLYIPSFPLVLIAIFIYFAAKMEYHQELMQSAMNGQFSNIQDLFGGPRPPQQGPSETPPPRPITQEDFKASPPPYAKKSPKSRFFDLFK